MWAYNRFRSCSEPTTRATRAMIQSTTACSHSSFQPPPRRITLREASIIQVVGKKYATIGSGQGIESIGNTYPERKIDGRNVPIAICPAASRVAARDEI